MCNLYTVTPFYVIPTAGSYLRKTICTNNYCFGVDHPDG